MENVTKLRMVAVGICLSNAIHSYMFGSPVMVVINLLGVAFNTLPEVTNLYKKFQG